MVLEEESYSHAEVVTTAIAPTHDALAAIAITQGSQPSPNANVRSKCSTGHAEQCTAVSPIGCHAK